MAWGQSNNVSLIQNTIKQLKENSIQSLFLIPAFMPINETNVFDFKNGLSQNTSLTELYMHGHQLGEEGLKEIGICIENHPNIKTISIGSSDIGLNLKELEILLRGVLKSKVLKNIDFSKQSISTESLKIIRNIIEEVENKNLVYMNFGENLLSGEESLTELAGIIKANENIEVLNIGGNQIGGSINEDFINTLINNGKNLKKLVLSANALSESSCKELSKLLLNSPSLKEIELNDCEINEIGGRYLGESLLQWKGYSFTATGNPMIRSSLTSSWLLDCTAISNSIKHLSLRGCFIGDEGVNGIMNAINTGCLPHLNLLDVAFNKLSLESLIKLGELVMVEGSKPNQHSIEYLDVSFNMFGRIVEQIVCKWIESNKITHLKCLSLNNTGMKFMDTFQICKTLSNNYKTTSLKLFEVMGNDERDSDQVAKEEERQKRFDEKQKLKQESGKEDDEEDEDDDEEDDVYQILSNNIHILNREKKLDFKWK